MKKFISFILSVSMAVTMVGGIFTVSAEEAWTAGGSYPIGDVVEEEVRDVSDEEAAELDKIAAQNRINLENAPVAINSDELKYFTNDYTKGYFYQQMNDDEKEFCKNVYEMATTYFTAEVDLPLDERYDYSLLGTIPRGTITDNDRLAKVFRLFLNDNPQLFYITGFFVRSSQKFYLYCYKDFDAAEERNTICRAIIANSKDIVDEVGQIKTTLGKVKRISEFIVEINEYDYDSVNNGLTDTAAYNQTIAGSLGIKTSVCAGYASAFSYFCNMADIPSVHVKKSGVHAWNRVQIYGDWYEIDTTWMDQGSYGINYTYYLKSTDSFHTSDTSGSHIASEDYYTGFALPVCTKNDPADTIITGDANGDGRLSLNDVILLGRSCVDETSDEYVEIADMNGDGVVTLADVILLGRSIVAAE